MDDINNEMLVEATEAIRTLLIVSLKGLVDASVEDQEHKDMIFEGLGKLSEISELLGEIKSTD